MSTLLYFCFYSSLNILKKINFVMRGGGCICIPFHRILFQKSL